MRKFYTCKNDIAFKEMFLKESNQDLLKALLESILKIEITNIKYKPQELTNQNLLSKNKRVDLLVDTNIGKINIEVNSEKK